MSANALAPEQKADGARTVLRELTALHEARFAYMRLALGVREICEHYGLPYPQAFMVAPDSGEHPLESLQCIGAAINEYAEYCEHGAALFTDDAVEQGHESEAARAPAATVEPLRSGAGALCARNAVTA